MAHLHGTVDPAEYRRKLLEALRRNRNVTADHAREAFAMLEETRKRILATLAELDPESFSRPMYQRTLDGVNNAIAQLAETYGKALTGWIDEGFVMGADSIFGPLATATGIEAGSAAIATDAATLLVDFSVDLVQGLTNDLNRRITREVQLLATGAQTPLETARRIGRNLTDPNHFRTIAHRARAITVTEIGRAQSLGQHQAQLRLAQEFEDVNKRWLEAHLPGARETHLTAEARYAPGGPVGPIRPVNKYDVAGYKASYPRDPALPAKESVNCHCVSLTVIGDPEAGEEDPLTKIDDDIRDALEPKGAAKPTRKPQDVDAPPPAPPPAPAPGTYEPPINQTVRKKQFAKRQEFRDRFDAKLADNPRVPDGVTPSDHMLAEWQKQIDKAEVRIQVPPDAAADILEQGRFKSQFETGGSGGAFAPEMRHQAEHNMFGLGTSRQNESQITNAMIDAVDPITERPIYGHLKTPDVGAGGASAYGEVGFVLKPAARDRATVTFGDSLAGFVHPSPINRIGHESIEWKFVDRKAPGNAWPQKFIDDGVNRYPTYVEAQIHGGVSVDDIDRVIFTRNPSEHPILQPIQADLDERGIPWEYRKAQEGIL